MSGVHRATSVSVELIHKIHLPFSGLGRSRPEVS